MSDPHGRPAHVHYCRTELQVCSKNAECQCSCDTCDMWRTRNSPTQETPE